MHNWAIIDSVYLYDGTLEGLFTITYKCLQSKSLPIQIWIEDDYTVNILDHVTTIETNFNHSIKMVQSIEKISNLTLFYTYMIFLSGNPTKSNTLVRYLISAFKYGQKINYMQSNNIVIEIIHLYRQVKGESHRLLGFLRFKELSNQFLYAEYESDNNVLQFLAEHFRKRLKCEIWMIHDKGRNQIALYNRKEYVIVDATSLDISSIQNSHEDKYLILWKDYFKNISIKERINKRCQTNFMPKKYWNYLPEVQ